MLIQIFLAAVATTSSPTDLRTERSIEIYADAEFACRNGSAPIPIDGDGATETRLWAIPVAANGTEDVHAIVLNAQELKLVPACADAELDAEDLMEPDLGEIGMS